MLTDTALSPITAYGITRDRFAAIATDTMRASLLTACGYQTQVMEFIDMEHTPKNLLIRAVRRKSANSSAKAVAGKALTDVLKLRSQLGVDALSLERRLNELGQWSSSENLELAEVAEGQNVIVEHDAEAAS